MLWESWFCMRDSNMAGSRFLDGNFQSHGLEMIKSPTMWLNMWHTLAQAALYHLNLGFSLAPDLYFRGVNLLLFPTPQAYFRTLYFSVLFVLWTETTGGQWHVELHFSSRLELQIVHLLLLNSVAAFKRLFRLSSIAVCFRRSSKYCLFEVELVDLL